MEPGYTTVRTVPDGDWARPYGIPVLISESEGPQISLHTRLFEFSSAVGRSFPTLPPAASASLQHLADSLAATSSEPPGLPAVTATMVNNFTIHDENDENFLTPTLSRRSSSRKALGQIDANVDRAKEGKAKKRDSSLGGIFAAPTPACTPFDAKKVQSVRIQQESFNSALSEKFDGCVLEEVSPKLSYRSALLISSLVLVLGVTASHMQAQGAVPVALQHAFTSDSSSTPLQTLEDVVQVPQSPEDEGSVLTPQESAVEKSIAHAQETEPSVEAEESVEEANTWDEAILSGPMQISSSSSSEVVAAGFSRLTVQGDLYVFDLPDSSWYSQAFKVDGCAYKRKNALWVDRSNCIPVYTREEEMRSCFPEREEATDWIMTLSAIQC